MHRLPTVKPDPAMAQAAMDRAPVASTNREDSPQVWGESFVALCLSRCGHCPPFAVGFSCSARCQLTAPTDHQPGPTLALPSVRPEVGMRCSC